MQKVNSKKNSALYHICQEYKRGQNDLNYLITFLSLSDKLALGFAFLMIMGTFLPWVSAEGLLTHIGLMGGGDVHFVLAIIAINQVRKVALCQIRGIQEKNQALLIPLALRKISLSYLLIGFVSTFSAIIFLVYFGTQNGNIKGIMDIRIGFYITIFCGLSILFCGFERFRQKL